MKYVIMGHSGSGKSTLAKKISDFYNYPLLYLDCVHFLPNWKDRDKDEASNIIKDFMNNNESWVIDGNYFDLMFDERVKNADKIIILYFNRISCLLRAYKRYFKYKGKVRDSMTQGCEETMDFEFIKWILYEGRTKNRMSKFKDIEKTYKDKIIIIKNQKELNKYIEDNIK